MNTCSNCQQRLQHHHETVIAEFYQWTLWSNDPEAKLTEMCVVLFTYGFVQGLGEKRALVDEYHPGGMRTGMSHSGIRSINIIVTSKASARHQAITTAEVPGLSLMFVHQTSREWEADRTTTGRISTPDVVLWASHARFYQFSFVQAFTHEV